MVISSSLVSLVQMQGTLLEYWKGQSVSDYIREGLFLCPFLFWRFSHVIDFLVNGYKAFQGDFWITMFFCRSGCRKIALLILLRTTVEIECMCCLLFFAVFCCKSQFFLFTGGENGWLFKTWCLSQFFLFIELSDVTGKQNTVFDPSSGNFIYCSSDVWSEQQLMLTLLNGFTLK